MTVKKIPRSVLHVHQAGSWYHQVLDVPDGITTDAYLFPVSETNYLTVSFDTLPTIRFTNGMEEEIMNDTNIWDDWDGSSNINPGVTAINVINNTGSAVQVVITIKTSRV